MDARTVATAVGSALTAFLVVAVVVIELLVAGPGAGIVGVVLGVVAAALAFAAVLARPREPPGPRGTVEAVAAFGWTVLVVLALSYVNAPAVGSLDGLGTAAVGLVVAFAVGGAVNLRLTGSSPGRRGGIT